MRVGTRKSQLAMVQTRLVMDALLEKFPGMAVEATGMMTEGDRKLQRSLAAFGGKGAFIQEIEQALLDGRIDLAVHSAKDLPIDMTEGLTIGAVLKREDSRDVWISCREGRLSEQPEGTVTGTGSSRRALQAMAFNPRLVMKDIRGNVQTRLRKLADGNYDGIILAAAGLKRLGYIRDGAEDCGSFELDGHLFYYECQPKERFLPAAGQGIIAIETRAGDYGAQMSAIHDEDTWLMFLAEKTFLKAIGGGCNAAAAVSTQVTPEYLVVMARYAAPEKEMETYYIWKPLTKSVEENRKIAVEAGRQAAGCFVKGEDQV